MATLDIQVVASQDDWNWRGASTFENGVSWNWGNAFNVAGGEKCGARFVVTGPASGDTITAAYLTVQARAGRADDISILIDGVAADNPAAPINFAQANALARTTANATQTWTANTTVGTNYNTVDITAVVQEIVDRPGWTSGNAMILVVRDNGSTGGAFQQFKTYNESPSAAPILHIEYTAGGGGGTDTPQSVDGTLTTAGTASKDTGKTAAGSVDLSGLLTAATSYAKAVAGTLTTAGALTTLRSVSSAVGGTLTMAGTLTKDVGKSFAGTLSTAGTIAKATAKAVAGALTPGGSSSGARPISTPTVLTTASNASSLTSLTTASFSPAANALLVVCAPWASGNGTTQTPMSISDTLSGGSLTWTKLEIGHYGTGDSAFTGVFYAKTGATPGSGTVTVTCQANASRRVIHVVQVAAGYNPTTPVKQSKTGTSTSSSPNISFDTLPDSDSLLLGVLATRNGSTNVTPGTGWTELVDTSAGLDHTAAVQYRVGTSHTSIPWASSGTLNAMIGIEVDSAIVGTNYPSSVAGVLSFLGALVTSRTYFATLSGSLPTSGSITRSIAKRAAGTLTTAGTVAKATQRAVAGTLTSSGVVARLKAIGQVVGGTLSFAGGIGKRTARAITGILSFLGSLVPFVPGAAAVDVTVTDAARTTVTLSDSAVTTVTLSDTSRSSDD